MREMICERCGYHLERDSYARLTKVCTVCGHYNQQYERDFSATQGKFKITDEMDKIIDEPSVEEV